MAAASLRRPPPVPAEALRAVVEVPTDALVPQPPPVPAEALARVAPRPAPPPVPAAARRRRRPAAAPLTPPAPAVDAGDTDRLVAAARGGDARAFNALIVRYRSRILALALHITGSAQDADDIAQDAFLRAWQRIGEFEGRSAFFTWLYRIALNRALAVLQKRRVRAGVDLDDPRVAMAVAVDASGAPQRALELRETYAHLVYAFDRLSPLLRATVVLTTLQGLSHPEVAALLDTTEGTVAWRMHEAREQLRRALDVASVDAAVRRTHSPEATAGRRATDARVSATRRRDAEPDGMSCALAAALAAVVYA